MIKDIQIRDNPPGRLLFRHLFQEEQGMREKNQFYPSVSGISCLLGKRKMWKTVSLTESMDSDGLGKSHQPERRGTEPIVSIIENNVPVSMSQKMDEGQQEVDQKILLTFMGLQPLSLNKVWKQ